MQVIVYVRSEVTARLRPNEHDTSGTREIAEAAREMGIVLKPMHPGVNDQELARYFTVEVPDAKTAESVIARLRNSQAIETAYLKPSDALPLE